MQFCKSLQVRFCRGQMPDVSIRASLFTAHNTHQNNCNGWYLASMADSALSRWLGRFKASQGPSLQYLLRNCEVQEPGKDTS
jgi:hypothetical protein